jgi:putative SOS response-associated peptidase YedK
LRHSGELSEKIFLLENLEDCPATQPGFSFSGSSSRSHAKATTIAMCGRFSQNLSWDALRRLADLVGQPRNLRTRYNIAPTTEIEVIRAAGNDAELVPMRWGLIPSWWKKPLKELPSSFNARVETVAEKPMFRAAFKSRRCIIPASGFYEWTGKPGEKTPHYFSASDGQPLAFAGLWESWRDPDRVFSREGDMPKKSSGEDILSATIIVGPADAWMLPYHDRMPVMLKWSEAVRWLHGPAPLAALEEAREKIALRECVVSPRV